MERSPLLDAVEQEIVQLEQLLECRRRIRQEILKNPLPTASFDVSEGWHPVVNPSIKTIELVVSYLVYRGRAVHVDELYQVLKKKGATFGKQLGKKQPSEKKKFGNLKAALSQNIDRVLYDKKSGMVALKNAVESIPPHSG